MSSIGIGSGLKALLAAQASLDTIGNNLANVNTPGYSRQRVDLASSLSVSRYGLRTGTGVDALGISRAIDELLEKRILGALGARSRLEASYGAMRGVESIFGELSGNGIGDGLDRFYSAASALAGGPSDPILQNDLVQGAKGLVDRFHEIGSGLAATAGELELQIEGTVDEVNAITDRIADINGQLMALNGTPGPANELLDERGRLVKELAKLVDVQEATDQHGHHNVFVNSNMVVAADRALAMETFEQEDGRLGVRTEGATHGILPKGGALGGLLSMQGSNVGALTSQLDKLAKALILNTNRAHSTGVPAAGAFHSLRGTNALEDVDGSGTRLDDLLGDAGLPFDVLEGELVVNVVDEATGDVSSHKLAIDPEQTTVGEFVTALDEIPGLRAWVDGNGYLALESTSGFGFDFSNRLDPNPDSAGTFGGAGATVGSQFAGPFEIAVASSLQLAIPAGGPTTVSVSFPGQAFEDFSSVSAEELADFLNSDAGFANQGLEATAVGGYLQLGTKDGGAAASFEITGGDAVASLGFANSVGVAISGSELDVDVAISGEYTGDVSKQFLFEVVGEGTVGTTEGLSVQVYDDLGGLVATLDVGPDYQPGEVLEVVDGIEVSFGLGELSESSGDRFTLDAVADSDTTDALVAMGVNSFFVGQDASSIDVRADLLDHPDRLSTSSSGTSGGNQAILDLVASEDLGLEMLDGHSLSEAYGGLIGDIGFEVSSLEGALESSDSMLRALEERRDQVSGVNTDEELVDLVRFEQSYAAAAQFLSVVSRLEEELLQIL